MEEEHSPSPQLYELLDILPTSTQEEIHDAYKKKLMEHHPDKGGSNEKVCPSLTGRKRRTIMLEF